MLDGSGTTEAEDFEMAKDFIFNFMKNVQTTCFSVSKALKVTIGIYNEQFAVI